MKSTNQVLTLAASRMALAMVKDKEGSDFDHLVYALSVVDHVGEVKYYTNDKYDDEEEDEEDECGSPYFVASELVSYIEELACSVLITDDGSCNWDNIYKLRNDGYLIYAGEADSFGWLTGCIETKRGVIVYG